MLASIHSHFVMLSRELKCNRFFTLLYRTVSRVMDETKSYCKKGATHSKTKPLVCMSVKTELKCDQDNRVLRKKYNKYLTLY